MNFLNFKYYKPKTIEEACKLLAQNVNAAALAGGTDVLVEIKKGLRHNENIVSLSAIDELKKIDKDSDKLIIGAGATHNAVKYSPLINNGFEAISEAASLIGTEQIRNTGTIGGNLCTGASCCDMAPVLIAYDAEAELVSLKGKRTVPLKDFFISHHVTALENGEIMTKIIVSDPGKGSGVWFEKFGLRDAAAISVASAGAMIKTDGKKCLDAKIVIGAVAPSPKLSEKASSILMGTEIKNITENSSVLEEVVKAAADDSLPIDDIRGTAGYRRHLVAVLTKRAVNKAAKRAIDSLKN